MPSSLSITGVLPTSTAQSVAGATATPPGTGGGFAALLDLLAGLVTGDRSTDAPAPNAVSNGSDLTVRRSGAQALELSLGGTQLAAIDTAQQVPTPEQALSSLPQLIASLLPSRPDQAAPPTVPAAALAPEATATSRSSIAAAELPPDPNPARQALLRVVAAAETATQATVATPAAPVSTAAIVPAPATTVPTAPLAPSVAPPTALAPTPLDTTQPPKPSPLATLIDTLRAFEPARGAEPEARPIVDRLDAALDAVLAVLTPVAAQPPAEPQAVIAQTPATETPAATHSKPVPLLPLAEALDSVANRLEPAAPLAEKLHRLTEAVRSGGLDAAALAKLGLTSEAPAEVERIDRAIEALLATPPPARETRAAQPDFARVHLGPPPPANAERPVASPPAPTAPPANENAAPTERHAAAAPTDPRPGMEAPASADARPAIEIEPGRTAAEHRSALPPTDSAAPENQPVAPTRVETLPVQAQRVAAVQAYASPPAHAALPQIAFEIARHGAQGSSRFQIRLDPVELGRIDVDLDIDQAGQTTARLVVERAETLDLLKRDQPALERALAQAGLDQNRTTLEFSLREDTGSERRPPPWLAQDLSGKESSSPAADATATTMQTHRGNLRAGGLDLLA